MVLLERKDLLQKIFSRIIAGRPQSISITGDTRIGKTVLMQQIMDPGIQKKYVDFSKDQLFYYKNLGEFKTGYLSLIKDIILSFSGSVSDELLNGDNVYNTLADIIAERHNETTFIIVLDNFNILTQDYSVPLEFFSFLRSLANSFHVAYIISSVCPLQGLCSRKEVEESPFFNIFTNFELKTFTNEECERFLSMTNKNADPGVFKNLTGMHPYLMQQVILFMNDDGRLENPETVKRVLSLDNEPFVQELLAGFPAQHARLLRQLAIGIRPTEKEQYIVNSLIKKGYVDPDRLCITSEIIQSVLASAARTGPFGIFSGKFKKWFSFRKQILD